MVKVVWAKREEERQLYLVDEACEFIQPVKQYLDYLAAIEKSPYTLENYCRHLCHYFTFLELSNVQWRQVTPDDLVHFIQWLRNPLRQMKISMLHHASLLSERSVNTILSTMSSFYRYHIQRGEIIESPFLSEQFSNRFSGFKPFLIQIVFDSHHVVD